MCVCVHISFYESVHVAHSAGRPALWVRWRRRAAAGTRWGAAVTMPPGKTNSTKVRITGAAVIVIYEAAITGITASHVTLALFMDPHGQDNAASGTSLF